MLGAILMAYLPAHAKAGKLIGNYMTNCIGASLPLLYSWVAANYAGHTKKVVMNAVLLMSFCLGNIIGPETFRKGDAPEYLPAKITIVVTTAVAICLTIVLRIIYQMENRRRERRGLGVEHKVNQEFLDLTDRENGEFRVSVDPLWSWLGSDLADLNSIDIELRFQGAGRFGNMYVTLYIYILPELATEPILTQ